MAILTHGSDLRLAPTLRELVSAGDGTVRFAISRLTQAGFESVQLDATLPGLRPRELSRRARLDLSALIARHSLQAGGIDLFLPRPHFAEPAHSDRAVAATLAAIELAADLGRLPLSIALPIAQTTDDIKSALVEAADARGIRLAVHAEDQLDALLAWVAAVDLHALGAAIDPAALLARDEKPVKSTQRLGRHLAAARLSDLNAAQMRCPPGDGELDLQAYRITLDLAPARAGPVILDLRGLKSPYAAAAAAKSMWEKAAFVV